MNSKTLSVVIPVFNEEASVPELWRRLSATLEKLPFGWEVIFVDDGSIDRTGALLDELAGKDARVKVVTLSRNFGHQAALAAGLDHARGDAVVLMDGDLQDRPEALAEFVKEWEKGAEVVYAVRVARQEPWPLRACFKVFYWLLARASRVRQPVDAGIFCLVDRRVADVIRAMPERNRYFPGLRAYAGFRQKGVPVERDARPDKKARVGFWGLVRLALDAIFAFSYAPIRVFTFLGLAIAACSFLFLVKVVVHKLLAPQDVVLGIASLLVAVLLLGGLQLIMLGVVGEYIGRIYEESKRRPYYVVAAKRNLD